MNNKRYFLLGLLMLLTVALFAAGEADGREGFVQVTGTVRLVGSGAFPQLVITSSRVQWYIAREDWDKLFDLQQQTVTVEGIETLTEMIFASGRSAGMRRDLHSIRIISVGE